MFDAPVSTIFQSLNNLLENPKEYLADVCFVFESIEIWAHQGIILARAPKEFIEKYLPELLKKNEKEVIKIDMNHNAVKISVQLFKPLIRFWYTAQYFPVEDGNQNNMQYELEQIGIQLGTAVLPLHCESIPDSVQLINDLKEMRKDNIATDVTIHLVSKDKTITIEAHRFILAVQSSYFYALFCTEFCESNKQKIHFEEDLFNESILDMILNFLYTDKISVAPLKYDTSKPFSAIQRKLQQNKHALRVIQKGFYAADYLGHNDTIGKALLIEMEKICHQFKCYCSECASLLPSMLVWSDKHEKVVPKLKRTLILLYSDPIQALPILWSQRPFSLLITSFVQSTETLGKDTLNAVKRKEPLFRSRIPETLIHEIVERTFYNITKHIAIHVLHSIHLCLSHIRSADPKPTWSQPILDLLNPILEFTVNMVCQYLDFYCGEYPILLSCVDGIGAGFSIDFLDFLLSQILQQGIQIINAGIIYQVIVRDLGGRQEVVKNMAIDDVLIKSRLRCATFISKNWTKIKSKDGFRLLDKSTLRQLSDDINIPYRNLSKLSYENEFSNIFSFKPKKSKKIIQVEDKREQLTQIYTRRLSLGNLMTRRNSIKSTRPRALSTETVLATSFARYHPPPPTNNLENPPFINLLSQETDDRRKALEEADNNILIEPSISSSKSIISNRPLLRTSSSFSSLTDQLLPIEGLVITPLDDTPRPTRLKFELPTTPARSKSPNNILPTTLLENSFLSPNRHRRGSKSRIGRWSIGSSNNSDISDDEDILPALGNKIELLRRPLPTMGTIKYIGPVRFAEGTYIGVELESRLGKSDGSVDGIRYFYTDPQRALFVKPDDFKILD